MKLQKTTAAGNDILAEHAPEVFGRSCDGVAIMFEARDGSGVYAIEFADDELSLVVDMLELARHFMRGRVPS